jgi:hypothetical protein
VVLDPVDFRIAIPGSDTMSSALDPEAITEGIREDMASEDARHGGELGAMVFESAASLSLDVLSLFAKKTPEEKRDWRRPSTICGIVGVRPYLVHPLDSRWPAAVHRAWTGLSSTVTFSPETPNQPANQRVLGIPASAHGLARSLISKRCR